MNIYNWHRWYAWKPVWLNDGYWAWLRPVQRMHTTPAGGDVISSYACDREGYWVYKEPTLHHQKV